MGEMSKDPNVLMRRWMVVYMNLNIMRSTDSAVSEVLEEMKDKLAHANELVMAFFDMVGAEPKEEA